MSTIEKWFVGIAALIVGLLIGVITAVFYYRKGFSVRQKKLQEDIVKADSEAEKLVEEFMKKEVK